MNKFTVFPEKNTFRLRNKRHPLINVATLALDHEIEENNLEDVRHAILADLTDKNIFLRINSKILSINKKALFEKTFKQRAHLSKNISR